MILEIRNVHTRAISVAIVASPKPQDAERAKFFIACDLHLLVSPDRASFDRNRHLIVKPDDEVFAHMYVPAGETREAAGAPMPRDIRVYLNSKFKYVPHGISSAADPAEQIRYILVVGRAEGAKTYTGPSDAVKKIDPHGAN